MTFLYKLAQRFSRLKVVLPISVRPPVRDGGAFLVFVAALASCDVPARPGDPIGQVVQILVAPESLSLTPDQQQRFVAFGRTANGDSAAVTVSWSATGGSITGDGLFAADTVPGDFAVSASSAALRLSAPSQIRIWWPPVASVTVAPTAANLQVGQTVQLSATPRDVYGRPQSWRRVTWVSDNAASATVTASGLVTATAEGSASIIATSGGQSGSAAVTVTTVPVAAVTVSPATASLQVGQTVQLTATPRDANGAPLTGRVVTWASDNTAVATVNASGLVTARASGSATITATSEGQSGSAAVTVSNVPVASVTVSPATASLQVGQTVQVTATPRDANGAPLTGRVVTWGSDNTAVATVNTSGLVTARASGSATITATSERQSGSATITVTQPPAPVASVSVTPASLSLTAGQTGQLTATPRDANGAPLTGRVVTWASDNTAAATVNASGLVTARTSGSATITATSEGQSGSATATVTGTSGTISGLDFPGSAGVTTTMRFQFTSPMAAYPATYIWRVYPRRQTGYYTAFFHANNSANFDYRQEYYGFHPYPDPPLNGTPRWEISIGGTDQFIDPVVFDRWYVQVAICYKSGSSSYNIYYWNWPDTTTNVVRWVGPQFSPGPNPAIIVGDAPWNQGNEVWNGIMRGFQFYDGALTPTEIAQEIAAPGSVRRPWYLNLNPTPTDISDKSGNGHHPSWVGPERPTLWTGP